SAQAAIELVSFTATQSDGQVLIEWETATEFNNAGFFIVRSTEAEGEYTEISPWIDALGDGVTGGVYDYTDTAVTNGVTYFYKLKTIGIDQSVEYYGPVSATPGMPTSTPTLTPTAGLTLTATTGLSSTPTLTPTGGPSPTPTLTPTRTPTWTRTPFGTAAPTSTSTATLTPSPSATITATAVITATATLIPLPDIEYAGLATETPSPTITPSPTCTLIPTATPEESGGFLVDLIQSGNLLLVGIVTLVVAGWAVLAIGVYIYIRRRTS
ncbi:MAG: hypothetical protein ABIG63_21365, partial [Chloroflexota bacterium]